ncbi:hypothetical protein GCM10009677_62750 [Sphaerisporangium rubeum]
MVIDLDPGRRTVARTGPGADGAGHKGAGMLRAYRDPRSHRGGAGSGVWSGVTMTGGLVAG